jgi:hypothetical protein
MEVGEFVMMANGSAGMVTPLRETPEVMNETLNLELTPQQRDLVLEGLRYVRSSRRFEFRETSAPPDERREGDLRMIGELMGQLDSTAAVPTRVKA